jgi:ferrochelatase
MPLNGKIGVLLVNLGTPDSPNRGDVYKYLKEFLLDKRVIDIPWLRRNLLVRGIIAPFRSSDSSKVYKMLWTDEGSPLKFYGERLRDGVQELLGSRFVVELAMRYQNPSLPDTIKRLLKEDLEEIVVLPLFPQYASASTGSVNEEVMRILGQQHNIPQVKFINSFYDYGPMIDVFVDNARKFDVASYDHVLLSYHGLPQRQIAKGDSAGHCFKKGCCNRMCAENRYCYSAHCYATTRAIVKKMGLKEGSYTVCFQSRLGKDPWVQPYTSDVLEERAKAGDKRLLVLCPAFVADCLETTIEVKGEYAEEFEKLGGQHVDLVESLNDHPKWIAGVKDLVLQHVSVPVRL